MRYLDNERDTYSYLVQRTLNGYAVFVYNEAKRLSTELTQQIAGKIGVMLPQGYKPYHNKENAAIKALRDVASVNNFQPICK